MPIHVAITRRVRPGCEADFQQGLREFMQSSLTHDGVVGANMLAPLDPSSREFGILRSFANEAERDAFYASPLFKAWEERVGPLTEGDPVYKQLHGLEAWFRSGDSGPPRWKMAVATYLGVLPVAMVLNLALGPLMQSWSFLTGNIIFNACIVVLLTWVVMPVVTYLLKNWLKP